jgi:hypothetical protein
MSDEITFSDGTKGDTDELVRRVKRVFSGSIDDIADALLAKVCEEAPVDAGLLSNTDNWDTQKVDDFSRRIKSMQNYSLYVHQGTGPAAGHEQYWPNMDALGKWASRHGIENVYLLARHIYRYGIEPNPFADRAIEWMNRQNLDGYTIGRLQSEGVG